MRGLRVAMDREISSLTRSGMVWPEIFKAGVTVGVPFLLVVKQPDLGTSLTYLPILVIGLFLGGIKLKDVGVVLLAGMLVVPMAWKFGMKPYQKERLVNFIHPENDPKGSGYQIQDRKSV